MNTTPPAHRTPVAANRTHKALVNLIGAMFVIAALIMGGALGISLTKEPASAVVPTQMVTDTCVVLCSPGSGSVGEVPAGSISQGGSTGQGGSGGTIR